MTLLLIGMGASLGVVCGFVISGEGYGWLLNAFAGALGAIGGCQFLAGTGIDLGPMLNGGMAACAASGLTGMLLRS